MSMFDEMLARLGEQDVPDAEIRQIMEKAVKESGVFVDSPEAQAMLAKIMEVAQAKMGNKDIRMDENVQPLDGFNVALDLATRGDNGFQGDKPAEAFKEIEDIKNRATALDAPASSYDHQAVASDLIRATRGVEPETPELSAKLLNMQSELFASIDGSGHYIENAGYRLETYNKSARYFGDEKVADAYMHASEKEVYKFKGGENNYPSDDAIAAYNQTMHNYRQVATDHPQYAESCFEAAKYMMREMSKSGTGNTMAVEVAGVYDAVAGNPKVSEELRQSAKYQSEILKRKYGLEKETPAHPVDKEQTADFVNKAKSYAGGSKLFDKVKTYFKDCVEKNIDVLKDNPKLAATVGGLSLLAGMGTGNPALTAAGATIMTAGFCYWKSAKLKEKTTHKEAEAESKVPTFDAATIQMLNTKSKGGR